MNDMGRMEIEEWGREKRGSKEEIERLEISETENEKGDRKCVCSGYGNDQVV